VDSIRALKQFAIHCLIRDAIPLEGYSVAKEHPPGRGMCGLN